MAARTRHRRGGAPARATDRKTLQLCAQVRRTLEGVLTGELDDDVLRMLFVERVEPAPDASRLMVTVAPFDRTAAVDPGLVLTKLNAVAGRLRTEVAHAISRRKAPDLMFQISDADGLEDPGLGGDGPPDPFGDLAEFD